MMMHDKWFPATDSQQVVGRVIEVPKVHPKMSKEEGREVTFLVPVMEARVAGSQDVSHQQLKEFNREEICRRFPGAWEYYMKSKGEALHVEPVRQVGTSIDEIDFIPRAKITWLKTIGFSSVEQLAEMTDAQTQQLGTGSKLWRKKAKEFLATGAKKAH